MSRSRVTKTEPCYLLIDGDMVAFRWVSAAFTEVHWDEKIISAYIDFEEVKTSFKDEIDNIIETVPKMAHVRHTHPIKPILCFSDVKNFRKDILDTYKANRKSGRKPLGYWPLVDWVKEHFNCFSLPTLEADDCVGILATTYPLTIAVSGDKDFKTIPGRFYNWLTGEYTKVTKEQADRFHLYQTLIGDIADNYRGCPGIGPVTANKILDKDCSWEAVVKTFEDKGLTEQDALVQARIARILRSTEYDMETHTIKLWTPPKKKKN